MITVSADGTAAVWALELKAAPSKPELNQATILPPSPSVEVPTPPRPQGRWAQVRAQGGVRTYATLEVGWAFADAGLVISIAAHSARTMQRLLKGPFKLATDAGGTVEVSAATAKDRRFTIEPDARQARYLRIPRWCGSATRPAPVLFLT